MRGRESQTSPGTQFFSQYCRADYSSESRAADLDEAHKALEEYYRHQLQDVDPGYYLFSFSDVELLEIVAKPDEWGHFDYVLARALLADRGLEIPDETVEQMKQQRLRQLAKESVMDPTTDSLVAFGTLLDNFFGEVKKIIAYLCKNHT
jgi:hypothetical protein